MKISKICRGVYHIKFKSQKDICSTMMRFQETYESPKFRGKSFTVKEFKEWYKKKNGRFTYCSEWSGFNIPSYVFDRFKRGEFDPLTKKEKKVLELLSELRGDYYIIATYSGDDDSDTLKHEICHALYYTNSKYRKEVDSILSKVDLTSVYKMLKKKSYHESVWEDEANAYICASSSFLDNCGTKYPDITDALNEVFKKYYRRKK